MSCIARILFASVVAAGLCTTADSFAASESKARELIDLLGVSKMTNSMVPMMIDGMVKNMRQGNPSLPPDLPDIVGKVVLEVISPLLPQINDATVKVYADNLTDKDIDAALAFYRTESGQHLVQKLPILAQQGAEAGQRIMGAHMGDLQMRLQAAIKEKHPELQ